MSVDCGRAGVRRAILVLLAAALLLGPAAGCRRVIAVPPKPLSKVEPAYPEIARQRAVRGVVLLRVLVARDGTVSRVRVTRSIPELDAAATDAVKRWTFRPATIGGRQVAAWITVPMRFATASLPAR